MPMMAAQFFAKGLPRLLAIVGICCSCVIVVMCASSTPVMAIGFVILGFCFFPLRPHMRLIRWGLVGMLIGLHLCMKQPVWHLISRIDLAGGSTGYYRFVLIDEAINHFSDWALLGIDSTERWRERLFDVTNQYILEGVRGGALTMVLFMVVVGLAFRGVGKLWRKHRDDRRRVISSWALGVAMFVHAMNFIGVSYFGQINMVWYLLLATIASLSGAPARSAQKAASYSRPKREEIMVDDVRGRPAQVA